MPPNTIVFSAGDQLSTFYAPQQPDPIVIYTRWTADCMLDGTKLPKIKSQNTMLSVCFLCLMAYKPFWVT